jgi:hypothetical protein
MTHTHTHIHTHTHTHREREREGERRESVPRIGDLMDGEIASFSISPAS